MNEIVVTAIDANSSLGSSWDSYIADHPDATLYHTRAWCTIQEKSFGYRPWLLMALEKDTGRVAGVLPLYRVATPFSSRLVSVPFRDRGGPLWSRVDAFDALLERTRKIASDTGASSVQLKSLRAWSGAQVHQHVLTETFHWMHSVVPLAGLTVDDLWKRLGSKTRNMIRQAEGQGLTFHEVTATASALDDWYKLHLVTQKRLGVPPFPKIFFAVMMHELGRLGAVSVYCVRRGSATLSATLVLRHRDTGMYGYSASSLEAQQLRSNDLMLYRVMCNLIENGYTWFDMGSDAPGQDSLLFFKRKWGALQHQIPTYSFGIGDLTLSDSSSPRYVMARKLFTRLPISCSTFAGRLLTRYLG